MVDHERPGTIDMRKVNLSADDKNALGNYKALEAALSKIGVDRNSMDIQNLTKGQPQATLELLQTLHQHLVGGGGEADTPRGAMSSLDPNVEGSAGSRKRKAALPGGPRQPRKAPLDRGLRQPDQFGKARAGEQIVALHVMQDFPVYRVNHPKFPISYKSLQLLPA